MIKKLSCCVFAVLLAFTLTFAFTTCKDPGTNPGGGSTNIEMVYVSGGSFEMGNPNSSVGLNDEQPIHMVTLSGFYIGKYEVTQAQYQAVMGKNPSYFSGTDLPVECVSWYDALVFCNKLSIAEGLTPAYRINGSTDPSAWGSVPTSGNSTWNAIEVVSGSTGYRLPTEAQWEYAAKGGNGSPGNYTYAGSNNVGDVAWYSGNSGSRTHEAGTKAPNGLGIYDMSGNVREWCWDWYGSYSSGVQTDPAGASSGSFRVSRGGGWIDPAVGVRSANRGIGDPYRRFDVYGFRLLRPEFNGSGEQGTAPTITTTALTGGTVGAAYGQTLTATGDAPITWNIESGSLPTGLTLSGNSISGTPAAANTFYFTVKAANAAGNDSKALSIVIAPGTNTGVGSTNIEMVYVPGGSFEMGKELNTDSGYNDETPVHKVTLSGFFMGKYEVTQAQYEAVIGTNPVSGYGVGNNYPVYYVSWYDALVFCNKLSAAEGLTPAYRINGSTDPSAWGSVPTDWNTAWDAVEVASGSTGYRLPTEAQWEYAAKGGNGSPGNYTYAGSNNVGDVAWYSGNSGSSTHEVGTKAPNGLGIYDMSGNVYELCWDWYGSYSSGVQTDPTGASSGFFRVERGGSWGYSAESVRSALRGGGSPGNRHVSLGFRLLRPAQ